MDLTFKIKTFQDNIHQSLYFEPTKKQREFIENLRSKPINLMRKSRQVGVTTTLAMETLSRVLSKENYHVIYVPATIPSGIHFMQMIADIFSQQYNLEITMNKSKTKFSFSNGSTITMSSNATTLMGSEIDWVILDETFYNTSNSKHIVDNSLALGCDVVMASGLIKNEKVFQSMYYKALAGIYGDWRVTDFLWYDNPKFNQDIVWKRDLVEIPDKNCGIQAVRLLELGFRRTSPEYEKYKRMFGLEDEVLHMDF